jgi:hypothetical protein
MTLDDRQQAQDRQGLLAWAGFPADRQPRPLVLLSSPVRPVGFPDAQTKRAFLRGAFEAVPGFPSPVLQALRSQPEAPGDHAGPPLLLTAATAGQAEFATDRGRRQLPAWEVRAQGVPEPLWVLDPTAGRLAWRPPGQGHNEWHGSTAVPGTGGRALTMTFSGIPCAYADYPGAEILESGAAVAIVPVPRDTGPRAGPRLAYAEKREVTAVLARPLGHRVLLDATGSPVMVNAVM